MSTIVLVLVVRGVVSALVRAVAGQGPGSSASGVASREALAIVEGPDKPRI